MKQSSLQKRWGSLLLVVAPQVTLFNASNGEDVAGVRSILALHASFAADVYARNTEKHLKTDIAWNAEHLSMVEL